jgi:hypothetical protein
MRSKQSWMPSRGADATLPGSAREASMPRPAGRRRRGSKRWLMWLASATIATAAYFFLTEGQQSILYDAIGIAAALIMFVGVWTNRSEPLAAWVLLPLGVMTLAVGDIVYGTYQRVPSLADMMYVSGHAVLGAGLVALIRASVANTNRSAVVDAVGIAAAVAVASFVFIGTIHSPGADVAESAVSIAYPLMDVVLFGLVVRLVMGERGVRTHYLLMAGAVLLLLIADAGYTFQGFGADYTLGGGLDAAWLLSYAMFGAALLHPATAPQPITVVVPPAPVPGAVTAPPGAPPRAEPVYQSARSSTVMQALRLRRVLSMAGLMALSIGAIAFLLGVSWRASDAVFLSGVYGTTGSLMVISSLFHSATWNRRTAPVRLVRA